jgi:hypothetical protein
LIEKSKIDPNRRFKSRNLYQQGRKSHFLIRPAQPKYRTYNECFDTDQLAILENIDQLRCKTVQFLTSRGKKYETQAKASQAEDPFDSLEKTELQSFPPSPHPSTFT